MTSVRTACIPLFLLLCASVAYAQESAPPFPIVSEGKAARVDRILFERARIDAASLARVWLRETEHPAYDSIDFPPGLITSLRNALVILTITYSPALDSVRSFKITPDYWDNTAQFVIADLKRAPWLTALFKGKRKTGNRTVDTLVARYGLRVTALGRAYRKDAPFTIEIDSLVNMSALYRKLLTIQGVKSYADFAEVMHGWKKVKVSAVDGKWRFNYEFVGAVDKRDWRKLNWLFDVAPDGSVTHVGSTNEDLVDD